MSSSAGPAPFSDTVSTDALAGLAARLPFGDDAPSPGEFSRAVHRAASPSSAAAGMERLLDVSGDQPIPGFGKEQIFSLFRVLGGSPALARYLAGRGEHWPEAALAWQQPVPSVEELETRAAIPEDADLNQIAVCMRRMGQQENYRIGARELLGLADLSETLTALTGLAEAALQIAVRACRRALVRDGSDVLMPDGRPIGFVVVGLGKLGGRELNYSSDIDIAYYYEVDSPSGVTPTAREFFTRLATEVTRAVGSTTSDGHVFRVDLRLRPEGLNGPLVNPVEAVLEYYETWGDTWERGALAKLRPVAGDMALGEQFVRDIEPFIFRKHLDFRAVEDLRNMKERIDAEQAVARPGVRNVKIGCGGIRELEFVVQALQLVHGGHHPSLRVTGTRSCLALLLERSLIATEEAAFLAEAYEFLRRVEHAVQIEERRQTQELPRNHAGMLRLARRLGFHLAADSSAAKPYRPDDETLAGFEAEYERATGGVHDAFERFLGMQPEENARPSRDPRAVLILARLADGEEEEAASLLNDLGFVDGHAAATALARLYGGGMRGPASPQRRRALEMLAPDLLAAVASSADPERALTTLVEFLLRTGAHTSYLALFGSSPRTMELLVEVFASSPYLASHLVGRPELLDSLVRSDDVGFGDGSGRERPVDATGDGEEEAEPAADRDIAARDITFPGGPETCRLVSEGIRSGLAERLAREPDDEEGILHGLRRFRTAELLRIGVGDLGGALSAERVHAELTVLADVCLEAAVRLARELIAAKFPPTVWEDLELSVIAMGKYGGAEMSYGSDLDLIFVYETAAGGFQGEAHQAATRWVQKTLNLLTAKTRDGMVYEVDARLRPSGHGGPLVISLERFVEYHHKRGELWERQALIRGRLACGSESARLALLELQQERVYGLGLDPGQVEEIDALRRRMEDELAGESSASRNLKTGRGGIVDIEFLTQMLQLRHGAQQPRLWRRSTPDALRALRDEGVLPENEAEILLGAYRFLRRLEARLRLERDRPVEQLGTDTVCLRPLARRMGVGGEDPGGDLLASVESTREQVRSLYESYFSRPDGGVSS